MLDIAQHYSDIYQVKYGASKTKITISVSELDRIILKISHLVYGRRKVEVVEDNEHLGQIISGNDQYAKNIDHRIQKSRNSLFSMLGPTFQYKNLMSPAVKIHLFRTNAVSILR